MNFLKKTIDFALNVKIFLKNLFLVVFRFILRLRKSFILLAKPEKILVLILLSIFLVLGGLKVRKEYIEITRPIPGFGGAYREAMVGEVQFLNPILISTDADRSVSNLIFSGLVKINKDSNVLPDIARSWQISPDGLKYSFILRDNVYFQDGEVLTSSDIAFTINSIKDPGTKSPFYDTWKDIDVSIDSPDQITFTLPKPYGPFIYNCDVGILPQHLSSLEFAKKIVGAGPYKYVSSDKVNNKIVKIYLDSNSGFYDGRPYINQIQISFFQNQNLALQNWDPDNFNAAAGFVPKNKRSFSSDSFSTSKRLALIPNLRKDQLKDQTFRDKLFKDQKFDSKVDLTLTTLDADIQREKAESLKKEFAKQNVNLTIHYESPIELSDSLQKKNFELLLYGFDFGYDRDPYAFWHSTKFSTTNYAGYSDKNSDILLEDARMILDKTERNAKYDQFFTTLSNNSLAIFYDPLKYDFYVSSQIRGINKNDFGVDSESRFLDIGKWFTREDRTRK